MKFITLLVLACGASVGTFLGRFWVYDKEEFWHAELRATIQLLDILKDVAVYFAILSYLLK